MIDESAFHSFYEETRLPLWHYIVRVTMDEALADDVFQESYLRFLQSATEELTAPQLKSYLYQIATNCMRDNWRKTNRSRRWSQEARAERAVEDRSLDLRHDIRKAMDLLSLQQRSLLWLAYVEEYEHKEIARMLLLREKSVKVLLFRAKRKLAEILKRWELREESR